MIKKIILTVAIVVTLVGSMYAVIFQAVKQANQTRPVGSAQNGTPAVLATSSSITVGPGTNHTVLFNENQYCSSRVISTASNPIMLSFSTAFLPGTATTTTNPGGQFGFQQPASTTSAYDSGIYGCPTVSAYGFTASTTVNISEFR